MEIDPTTLAFALPVVAVAFTVALYAFFAVCISAIAGELGVEKRWYAWVPFLNVYLTCKIAGKRVLWTVLLFVPVVNIVMYVLVCLRFAKACARGRLYGVLLMLPVVDMFALWNLTYGKRPIVAREVPADG
jgi:hypothetical protein